MKPVLACAGPGPEKEQVRLRRFEIKNNTQGIGADQVQLLRFPLCVCECVRLCVPRVSWSWCRECHLL